MQLRLQQLQQPPDCHKAKYLVWSLVSNGLGSEVHTIGR